MTPAMLAATNALNSQRIMIYLFPGQGSQSKGMGEGLFERFPHITEEANNILGYDIQALCLEDPDEKLGQTQYTQPALFTVSALSYLAALETSGEKPTMTAGHSLGEYNALFAANAFDFATGLRLVQKRGALMAEAKGGGMAAVIGLTHDQVAQVLDAAGQGQVGLANLNAPTQIVVSGAQEMIPALQDAFKEAGAKRYIPLKVSGAFHSPFMEPAKSAFEAFLAEVALKDPELPVISNVEAQPYTPGSIQQLLAEQITSPVRWVESISLMNQEPDAVFEEIGPGNVLKGLLRQILR